MNASPFQDKLPWQGGWFTPLNLAVYVTWLAVMLQTAQSGRLRDGDVAASLGACLLVVMLASYLYGETRRDEPHRGVQRVLVLLQAAATLGAVWLLRQGVSAILLIIVAAQVAVIWPRRPALLIMGLLNLVLWLLWMPLIGPIRALLEVLPMIGFQTFAALVMHYARTADDARAELSRTHAELIATQHLLEDSARGAERLRLSRELHDVTGHKLTALRLNLRLLAREEIMSEREELATCATLVDELLADIRAVVGELRRHDRIDLRGAIEALTRHLPGTVFELNIDPELDVARIETAETLLRCAQEGITNALRHARARRIELHCRRDSDGIALRVRNDGVAPRDPVFGNGLNGMRERLQADGGALSLRALPEGGAELVATLPVPE